MTYLFVAYAIVWIGIFAYSYSLGRQAQRLREQIEALETALGSRQETAAPGAGGPGEA